MAFIVSKIFGMAMLHRKFHQQRISGM